MDNYFKMNNFAKLSKALKETPSPFYAGVVVVDKTNKRILLGKRRDGGMWITPGGGGHLHENPKQAAIREVFEESNIQLKPRDLKELPAVLTDKGVVCHCFMADIDSKFTADIHAKNDQDREVSKWQWFSLLEPLPLKVDHNRWTSINNAKMRIFGLRKSIIAQPEAGIDLNTAEQSADEMASRPDSVWIQALTSLMIGADYGDVPRELALPNNKKLLVSKVDDGIYSALLIVDDIESGSYGDVLVEFQKMTFESMVQGLKAKLYLPKAEPVEIVQPVVAQPEPELRQDFKGLFNALKRFQGDLHLHLAKAMTAKPIETLVKNDKIEPDALLDLNETLRKSVKI